nr:AAA family ATPase [Longilinea sp.]
MAPRLKSLELHGYKTFASRVVFEFPGNITAIVGPNGSGKSNVADSLRWVLGEQSYSLLRGRKTEDMIFSGSEQRPRAGMALASITFNNEDGWLPIDFSEVAVARRAYRDGDNEYWLNGQRVRLKEISELLAQSGLAERTYTIIGQGLVDSALSLKPEERRRFFEEAAGIGLYRSRREEALNRLDVTRRNLERVVDILSELEPRLKSLERQAQRAIEYERVKADLRLLLRDWYGYHWHHLQRELKQTRDVVQVQELRLEQARARLETVEAELTQQRQRLQAVRNQLNDWHTQLSGLHSDWEKVSRTLAIYEERQRALQEQEQAAQRERTRLEDEYKAQQARMAAIEEEQARLEDELQDGREQAAAAQRALEVRQRQRAQVEQELRDARRQMTTAETQQVQRKAHQNELNERIEALTRSQQGISQEAQAAQKA